MISCGQYVINFTFMRLVCPECKNDIDLSSFGEIQADQTLECNWCGINLLVTDASGDELKVEIVDEGK